MAETNGVSGFEADRNHYNRVEKKSRRSKIAMGLGSLGTTAWAVAAVLEGGAKNHTTLEYGTQGLAVMLSLWMSRGAYKHSETQADANYRLGRLDEILDGDEEEEVNPMPAHPNGAGAMRRVMPQVPGHPETAVESDPDAPTRRTEMDLDAPTTRRMPGTIKGMANGLGRLTGLEGTLNPSRDPYAGGDV